MRLMLVIITLISLSAGLPALADDDSSSSNAIDPEVVRKVMGDDLPDFQSILSLPSLSDDQREQVKGLMQNFENEVKPLKDELASISEGVLNGGSLTPEQMQQASQKILSGGGMTDASAGESKTFGRVNELRDQVKEKRAELWTQIKGVLTADQISQVQNI